MCLCAASNKQHSADQADQTAAVAVCVLSKPNDALNLEFQALTLIKMLRKMLSNPRCHILAILKSVVVNIPFLNRTIL
jgi:hypothetical protein